MAVVQISRIQVRRGKKNAGTGLPQLASGEIAWAIDTQELYIGNGSVSEGAPEVNNTKILTEHDSLLDLAGQYQYRRQDEHIQTGVDATHPVVRSLQERLDERLSILSFGLDNTGVDDVTVILQQAIDQIFNNPATITSTASRIVLEIPAGTYKISDTIYVPSNVTLIGHGKNKTFIEYIGAETAFVFINDSATAINNSEYLTQPRNITIKGMTIHSATSNKSVFKLDAVRDSVFEDLDITGDMYAVGNSTPIDISTSAQGGLQFNAKSALVTCQRNLFRNVTVSGFTFCVYSKQDILLNTFETCIFSTAYIGAAFGKNAINVTGEIYGPRNNTFTNCIFTEIKRQAAFIYKGYGNIFSKTRFIGVGNDGGSNELAKYSQIKFDVPGNMIDNLISDRAIDMADPEQFPDTAYIGEVSGVAAYQSNGAQIAYLDEVSATVVTGSITSTSASTDRLTVASTTGLADEQSIVFSFSFGNIEGGKTYYIKNVIDGQLFTITDKPAGTILQLTDASPNIPFTAFNPGAPAFRLPIDTDAAGYVINYVYRSTSGTHKRRGTLTIIVDTTNRTSQLTDEYDFVGEESSDDSLTFSARLSALNGAARDTLVVWYSNTTAGDSNAEFTYSYSAIY